MLFLFACMSQSYIYSNKVQLINYPMYLAMFGSALAVTVLTQREVMRAYPYLIFDFHSINSW